MENITITIIILIVASSCFIGASLATVISYGNTINKLYKNVIIISFIPTFSMFIMGVLALIELKNQKEVKKEKFEIVKETLYKKIE